MFSILITIQVVYRYCTLYRVQSPYFYTFMEPRNRFQGMHSASLCSMAGRYDNPLPPRCLAPIDSLKVPALWSWVLQGSDRATGLGKEKEVKPLPYCWHLLAFLPGYVFYSSACLFVGLNNILDLPACWSGLWRLASSVEPDPGSRAHPSPSSGNFINTLFEAAKWLDRYLGQGLYPG